MPVDNNMPHGNHFASNGPRPSGTGSSSGGNRRMPAPDTTEAFMMASRSGRTTKPAPAQPVASLGARTSMGGQSSYHQQSNTYHQQERAYATATHGAGKLDQKRLLCQLWPRAQKGQGQDHRFGRGNRHPRHRGVWRHHGLLPL